MKNSMEISPKIKTRNYHLTQQFHFLVFTQRNQNHYFENISTLQCFNAAFFRDMETRHHQEIFFLMWHAYNWILSNNEKKEILPSVTTWMDEGIMLSEVRQRKTYTNTVWPHLYVDSGKKKSKTKRWNGSHRYRILEETNDCQRQWLKGVKRPKATNFQL